MNSTVAVAGLIVVATTGLISLALILRFLWRVYERGGPTHVRSAADALRQVYDPNWAAKLGRFLPQAEETDARCGPAKAAIDEES